MFTGGVDIHHLPVVPSLNYTTAEMMSMMSTMELASALVNFGVSPLLSRITSSEAMVSSSAVSRSLVSLLPQQQPNS